MSYTVAMNYQEYRAAYHKDTASRYAFDRGFSAALYTPEYRNAVAFYSRVLGDPQYVEGELTHGWRIGNGWLTLFPLEYLDGYDRQAGRLNPVELQFHLDGLSQLRALRAAFISAGGRGPEPSRELMYVPLWFAPLEDPFGNRVILTADLPEEAPQEDISTVPSGHGGDGDSALHPSVDLEAILDSLPDPVVFVDTEHIVRYLNRTAREKSEWHRDGSLLGRSIFDCHNDNSRNMMLDMFERLRGGEGQISYSTRPGRRNWMTGVYDRGGSLVGYWERYEYFDSTD